MEKLYYKIATIGKKLGAAKIVLFSSRARGDNHLRSDIDIAVYGLDMRRQNDFREAVDNLPTLLDFDIVFITEQTAPALLANISQDGVILMTQKDEKICKFCEATRRLQEALAAYQQDSSDIIRDGVIQRFEFCTKLAWKATREYLLDQGYTEINSPKSVMRRAYTDGIISNDEAWLSLINDRNLTSHIYDDATAAQIFNKIQSTYTQMLVDLAAYLAE